ncbi:MAG: response regulator [Parcubacteria group bacterium]|nr:MAG: response regulator [Parcubacteria group bacterium]
MDGKKVIIVEDDEFLSKMYATKLDLEGFVVQEATSGLSGLKAIQKEKPDMVLLDLNLPEMDGFEVLRRMKEDSETKDIPVLVLTNYSQKDKIDRCLNLGAVDYLIKAHFVPSEVITKIKMILKNF